MHFSEQVHSSLLPYSAFTASHAGIMRKNTETVAFCQMAPYTHSMGEGFSSFALLDLMLNR